MPALTHPQKITFSRIKSSRQLKVAVVPVGNQTHTDAKLMAKDQKLSFQRDP
jgi:hypothetical protein